MRRGVFDVIGPVMLGPSSSHTAGVVRIGKMAREIFGEGLGKVFISFAGTLGQKRKALGSDEAITAGLLGFDTDDLRIKNAVKIAGERGMEITFESITLKNAHPATVKIIMESKNTKKKQEFLCLKLLLSLFLKNRD